MPGYPFLANTRLNTNAISARLQALANTGVPYTSDQIENAEQHVYAQADAEGEFEDELWRSYGESVQVRDFDGDPRIVTEMDALVAYLQMLGTLVDTDALSSKEVLR
jgi:cytochrome c oxidase cbb3-type subunit 2